LQERPIILRSLLIVATPYTYLFVADIIAKGATDYTRVPLHLCVSVYIYTLNFVCIYVVCVCARTCMYIYIRTHSCPAHVFTCCRRRCLEVATDCICVPLCVCMYMCVCMYIYIQSVCVCARVYTYVRIVL